MAYTPTLWAKGDKVTSEKLNKIEQGIVDKVDKETGKTLSTNDFTDAYKTKLDGIEANADKTTIDATLTNSGEAADAKATGDAIKDIENDLDGKVAIIESDLDEKVENLKSLVGTPLKATTASDMTDTSKIYVYTGNESGYTNGDWYYHDGSAWVDGGTYNSVAVEVDDTLTVNGMPADAKVVGDEIGSIKEDFTDKADVADLNEIIDRTPTAETLTLVPNEYVNTSGAFVPYNNWSRTDYIEVEPGSTISFSTPAKLEYNFSYDANKSPIGSKWTIVSGASSKTLGANVHYIALSGKTTTMTALKVYAGQEDINLKSTLPLTPEMESQVDQKLMIPDQVVNPTAFLMKGQIPNYYFSRNETALTKHDIGYLDDKINSIPEGYHFMFVTDTHWNDNAQQSAKLISYVRDRIGAKIVLFGGDILTAYSTDAIAYRWLCDFIFEYKNMFGSNFLPVVGNHDLNAMGSDGARLLYSDLVPVFTQGCDARFHYCDFYDARIDAMKTEKGMTDEQVASLKQYFRTCYYVDDVEWKARYIIYNTGAGNGGSGITEFIDPFITGSYEEMLVMEWVYDVLMHTPTGYNVIFCTHIPGDFSWSAGGQTILSSTRERFAAVVAGMKAKKNVIVYMPNPISDYSWWGGSTLTFDYTNAPDIGLLLVMGGHTHVDAFGKYGFNNNGYTSTTVSPGVQSDINATEYTVKQSSTAYGDGTYKYEIPIILTQHDAYTMNSGPHSHTMELGTITEQVIDVVTITPSGDVALTRIGAGNDRYLTIE